METTVSDMTVDQLRQMIAEVVEEELSKFLDPDHGLELRDEVREMLLRQSEEYKQGKITGASLEEVLEQLGIDKAEIEVERNVPVGVS